MGFMSNLKTDDSIENEVDNLGGSGPVESGIYDATVSLAYVGTSEGGAMSVTVHLDVGNREVRETYWVQSGNSKGNKNYYTNSNGEKKYLPGFTTMNSLSLLTVGKELADLEPEKKVIKLYNYDAKAEVPTEVMVLTELMGKQIIAGILKQTEDKQAKGDDGAYHATGETRDVNVVDKYFRAKDRMTTAEIRAGSTEPAFIESWSTKWTGITRDRTDKNATANSGNAGAPAAAKKASKPTQSLFA